MLWAGFVPRKTIQQVLETDPKRHVILLAACAGIASVLSFFLGANISLIEWRTVLALILGGSAFGVISLFVSTALYRWTGRWIGGAASLVELRAAYAFGSLPLIWALPVCALILVIPGAAPIAGYVMSVLNVWSVVVFLIMIATVQQFKFWKTMLNATLVTAVSLVAALLVRAFLFQPFSIPSGSMKPTLLVGDVILVSKYSYGYTHYSLPFSPTLFEGQLWGSAPQRGDVAVFRLPKDASVDYVMRVIGLPGDRVQMIDGVLHINGEPVKRERIEDWMETERERVKRWRETLPNGVSYATLDLVPNGFYDNTPVYQVPAGHYFVMGDNRDNSNDSRVLRQVGYIPLENFIGRVELHRRFSVGGPTDSLGTRCFKASIAHPAHP